MTRIITITFLLFALNKLHADFSSYSDSLRIEIKSKNFIITHFHNWTQSSEEKRNKMMSGHQDPFNSENNYSYIECRDKKSGIVIFKKPCPALTKIEISNDEKYILGISHIMIDNPYQMVIYNINGDLIKKRHITNEEAKLSEKQFKEFSDKFPKQIHYLDSISRVYKYKTNYYVDFSSMNMPTILDGAFNKLLLYLAPNHLSKWFKETTMNFIYWYDEIKPAIVFNYSGVELTSISLTDPINERISIKIKE